MGRNRLVLLVLVCLLLGYGTPGGARVTLAAAPEASCAPNSGTATISGTVRENLVSAPLQNVLVYAYSSEGQYAGSGYTNASGFYTIGNLVGGSYLLFFNGSNTAYQSEWYLNKANIQTATPVEVTTGGSFTGADITLTLGARISGTVTGDGAPLQSVQVRVYDENGSVVASATTNASGVYSTVPGVPPGNYRVGFTNGGDFLSSFYLGQSSLATATPVALVAQKLTPNIDAALTKGGTITGTVTNATTGLPAASALVQAQGANDSGYAYTNASGVYTIKGLESGTYTLEAGPLSENSDLLTATQQASVTAPQTTQDVNFALQTGTTLSGRVTNASSTPLPDITVYIGERNGTYGRYVSTNTSGIYTAHGLGPGNYVVLFRPTENYIPEAYNNHPNFGNADAITVTPPTPVTGIDAVLDAGASVSGKVVDAATNLPIPQIFVEILDLQGSRVESATTRNDGTYTTETTLPAGQYLVRFNADERFASCAYVTEYYDNKGSLAEATPITVAAGTPLANINAALDRGGIISGVLTDAANGAPITSGTVRIYDASGKQVMFGRLSQNGGWHSQAGLASGNYRIQFSDYDQGYVDEFYNDALTLNAATPVALTAPTDVTGINASLAKGALLSGTVTAAGVPFSDGSVTVFAEDGSEIGASGIETDGTFLVTTGLPNGNYRVGVVPYGDEEGISLASTSDYATSFYGNTVSIRAANAVAVSSATTTSGIGGGLH